MNARIVLSLAVILSVVGCGDKSEKPATTGNTPASSSPVTAPVDYLNAIAKGEQTAIKTVDTASLGQAIQQFNVENGRYPKDLNELVTEKVMPKLPEPPYGMAFAYNPTNGTVSVVKK